MKILITGVAGLIGSRLADYIIMNQPDVYIVGIDDLSGGYIENVNPKVELWQMNLINGNISECFERHQFDYVYHMAAYAAEGLSPFIRSYNYQNNLVATSRIINECIIHNVKRLIFTSTMAVYGHGNGNIFDETQVPCPVDPYGIAKYACEMDIKVAGEQHGLDWCIVRPHNVYGVKQNIWDKYRNVLGIWMYQHINGEPMTIFGDGMQKRAFSYVDDCLEPLWKTSQQDNCSKEIINLGGTIHYTINEANEILKNVIKGGETIYKEQRHEVKNAVPTWQKSVDLLDYKDETYLHDGLVKMWKWAQNQPNRERFVWENYEISKGIYEFWKK
jgi:UDP-glucose 4-epimerase